MHNIPVKRIYEPAAETDGYRILIDRLWPRGLTREGAMIDEWMKDIAPSVTLRKWFNHDPQKWQQFQHEYFTELVSNPVLKNLLTTIQTHKTITLLYAAKDEQYNHAIVLQHFLQTLPK
ncbi:MAG: hypothetical protein JWR09_1578 [Mucilaginibacter sp.]|nr:hypothetical protein [Mucilaginibacter sp.]